MKTPRLLLRRHVPEDAGLLYQNFGMDAAMYRYSGWNPYATPDQARETVQRFIDSYADPRFYGWAIECDGRMIGTIGAYDFDPEKNHIEVGFSIERASWGKGYAAEALRAVLEYLTVQEGIARVTAWCAADNIASKRTLEKAGMRLSGVDVGGLEIGGERYDKTAVGTSTFIMTFTALIASVSHILIHPAIVLEKWNVMLLCIVVATVASLLSARFANRVKNRTVGLVTGAVLTVLGAAMLILNFWEQLSQITLVTDILHCFGVLAAYIIPSVLILLPIRFLTKLPFFIFRKLLHIVAFTCMSLMILAAHSWQAAALTSVIIAAVIYPLLMAVEREEWYPRLFVEKKPGEIKTSMLMLFLMFAALIAVCWGIFGKPHLAATAILMWGTGDAAAALIGIPFGKHKVRSKLTDGKKSWEGSAAMLCVSLLTGAGMLTLAQGMPVSRAIPISLIAALLGTATELLSPSEYDTVTVPTVIAAALLLLIRL